MVKKRVGGAHRYKAVQKAAAGGSLDRHKAAKQQQESGPKPPSHLQRKITKSVKFYERVLSQRAPEAPQGVQKKQKKKAGKTLASLDTLAAELEHISAAAGSSDGGNGSSNGSSLAEQQAALVLRGKGTKSSIKRSKARLAVGVSESTRLHKVLQHPSFKADPVQAVLNHLMNTLPAAPEQQQQRKQGGAAGQQKRKKNKQGRGVADMQD